MWRGRGTRWGAGAWGATGGLPRGAPARRALWLRPRAGRWRAAASRRERPGEARAAGTPPRRAHAGNLGGWRVARALELIVVLMGAVSTPGGTAPSAWNKAVPAPPMMPPPGKIWSELLMPREYPLAFFEMSFLLPHFLREGRGKLAM